jgi:hypothetical protein
MSYILDALRKMERQKRRDSGTESWVDQLTGESDEEKSEAKGQGRLIVGVSIFFGVTGIIAALLFYFDTPVLEKEGSQAVQTGPVQAKTERAQQVSSDLATTAPASPRMEGLPKDQGPSPLKTEAGVKALTLSEIQSALAGKTEGAENEKSLGAKSDPPLTTSLPSHPKQTGVIDLTARYRLTSTGNANDRRVATIDGKDVYTGDEFAGMVITEIERDRVHLKRKGDGQRYLIIFRYK